MDDGITTIEGRSGEVLACALLKILLIHSSHMRHAIANRLQRSLPHTISPSFQDGIVCQLEYPTEDREGKGRIDLLITDPATRLAIAVEAKFEATIVPEQPRKYWQSLQREHHIEHSKLVLLVPDHRREEATDHIRKHVTAVAHDCAPHVLPCWTWSDLVAVADEICQMDRGEVEFWAKSFVHFVRRNTRQVSLPTADELVGRVGINNRFQRQFLEVAKTLFPDGRLTSGRNHVGINFHAADSSGDPALKQQWFGFVREGDECRLFFWFGWGGDARSLGESVGNTTAVRPNLLGWVGPAVEVPLKDPVTVRGMRGALEPYLIAARAT